MPSSFASLSQLSEPERAQVEALLVAFDQGWSENRLEEAVGRLPSGNSVVRRLALLELVKIDLERQWQLNRRPRLEGYLHHYSELGTQDTVPVELILAEFEVRRQFTGTADLADFTRRFPRQAEQLRQRVGVAPPPGQDKLPTSAPAPVATLPTVGALQSATADELPVAEVAPAFGHYQILRPLGGGGMGSVVLAWDTRLKRYVALKRPNLAGEGNHDETIRRFQIEAEALAALDHPNICQVYEIGKIDGVPYLTMSYIEGSNLSDLIPQRQPLPPEKAVALVQKLALALQVAHDHGVVHRDLKPQNVRINKRGEPVLVDFGLALRVDSSQDRITRSGHFLGTPAYMSPEHVTMDRDLMGPRCDIYSLGVVLYELLTGRVPFQGSIYELMRQILEKAPEAPSQHCRAVSPRLDALCLKALAKKPVERFATMAEMAAALGECVGPTLPPPNPLPKRRWLGKVLAAMLLLVLLGVAAMLASGVFSVKTKDGVIELTDLPPDAEVRVDGEKVTLKWVDGKVAEIGIKPGRDSVSGFRLARSVPSGVK
jgi:serine/threonine protein kinase